MKLKQESKAAQRQQRFACLLVSVTDSKNKTRHEIMTLLHSFFDGWIEQQGRVEYIQSEKIKNYCLLVSQRVSFFKFLYKLIHILFCEYIIYFKKLLHKKLNCCIFSFTMQSNDHSRWSCHDDDSNGIMPLLRPSNTLKKFFSVVSSFQSK